MKCNMHVECKNDAYWYNGHKRLSGAEQWSVINQISY